MPLYRAFAESNVSGLVADLALKAAIDSQAFTGTPSAPTPAGGDNTTKVATTAFVIQQATALGTASTLYGGL